MPEDLVKNKAVHLPQTSSCEVLKIYSTRHHTICKGNVRSKTSTHVLPWTPHLTPHTLHPTPTPHTPHLAPHTLCPTPVTLQSTPHIHDIARKGKGKGGGFYGLVSGAKRHSPDYTQLPPGHRTCSFISHLNFPGSIQPMQLPLSAHGTIQTHKPSLSYQVPTYSWVSRVHV